ncbi:hypothetical protein BJ956_001109 [Arthrobacter psychrochitiniphilus]|nr:hypothetical protein [Arthrobacter psychrochitiniphilus]
MATNGHFCWPEGSYVAANSFDQPPGDAERGRDFRGGVPRINDCVIEGFFQPCGGTG